MNDVFLNLLEQQNEDEKKKLTEFILFLVDEG